MDNNTLERLLKIKIPSTSEKYLNYQRFVYYHFLKTIPAEWDFKELGDFKELKTTSLDIFIERKIKRGLTSKTVQNFAKSGQCSPKSLWHIISVFYPDITSIDHFDINSMAVQPADVEDAKTAFNWVNDRKISLPNELSRKKFGNENEFRFEGQFSYITMCSDRLHIEKSTMLIKGQEVIIKGKHNKLYIGEAQIFRDSLLHINIYHEQLNNIAICSSYQFKIHPTGKTEKPFYHGFRIMDSAINDRPYVSRVILFRKDYGDYYDEIPIFPAKRDKITGNLFFSSENLDKYNKLASIDFTIRQALEFTCSEENSIMLGFVKVDREFQREINYAYLFFDSSVKLAHDLALMGKNNANYSNRLHKCLYCLDKCSKHYSPSEKFKKIVALVAQEIKEGVFSNPDIASKIEINSAGTFFYIKGYFQPDE